MELELGSQAVTFDGLNHGHGDAFVVDSTTRNTDQTADRSDTLLDQDRLISVDLIPEIAPAGTVALSVAAEG
ncbi:MAG: hypothetical protein WBW04_05310 [Nitrolancea sp.]